MIKMLLTAAFATTAIVAPAFAADKSPEKTFTRDGETYVYTTAPKANGVLITGQSYPSRASFELLVRGDQVSGTSNGMAVSFTYKGAQEAMMPELATR